MTAHTVHRTGQIGLLGLAAAIACLGLCALAAPALATAPVWQIVSPHQPTNFTPGSQEVQKVAVAATGGGFSLTLSGQTTAEIPFNASAATAQSALEALSNVGSGNVKVSGGPGDAGGSNPYVVAFRGALAGQNLSQMTANAGGLSAAPGTQLSCAGGPAGATLSYQWLRNGAAISGATTSTYTAVAADEGDEIQCRALAAGADGASAKATAPALIAPTPATAPPVAGTPTITGTANVGQTLTCNTGAWTGGPSFAYQWLRNGAAIAGATTSTYVLQAADKLTAIQCELTGANAGGSVVADSATSNVLPVPPAMSAVPTISGTLTVGNTLTCNNGTWSGSPTFAYQWLRNGAAIAGATSQTYVLAAADAGKAIQCQVTATNSDGAASAVTVNSVIPTAPSPLPPTAPATISVTGTYAVGSTLTCSKGTWGNSTGASYVYQWLRNGAAISGANSGSTTATSFTYALAEADKGASVQCQIVATTSTGASEGLSPSAATVVSPLIATATAAVTGGPTATVSTVSDGGSKGSGQYLLIATNVGTAASTGTITVKDTLPAGLATSATPTGTGWACTPTGAGQTVVSCTSTTTIAAGFIGQTITVPVTVSAGEEQSPLTNQVEISGGGALAPAFTSEETPLSSTPAPYGLQGFVAGVTDENGNVDTQAGGHPYMATTTFTLNSKFGGTGGSAIKVAGEPKDFITDLPTGFIANPLAVPACPLSKFQETNLQEVNHNCPASSQVGFATVNLNGGQGSGSINLPIYELAPEPGHPAELGFTIVAGSPNLLFGAVRDNGEYGLRVEVGGVAQGGVVGASVSIWGVPADFNGGGGPRIPYLTNPTNCSAGPLTTTIHTDSWENPAPVPVNSSGAEEFNSVDFGDPQWAGGSATVPGVTGCDQLNAKWTSTEKPSIDLQPENTEADTPAAYEVDVHIPQAGLTEPAGLGTSHLDDSTVTLPKGVAIDPSAADGVQSCTESQFGVISDSPLEFELDHTTCPDASKVGTLEVDTPVLEEPLVGSVYLAAQNANPFHSTFAIYLDIDDPATGIIVKLAGKVVPDPVTGQLTATFTRNPQLPFEDFKLKFFGGPRASLVNPTTCGEYTTTTALTPWSAADPENPTAAETATPSSAPFTVEGGPGGGACSPTPQSRPFAPAMSAGTETPTAGAHSPFTFRLTRNDGEQEFSSLELTTPPGFSADLKGVPYCTAAEIKAAEANSGKAELESSSCPQASQVGTVTTTAGAGEDPFQVSGKAYLAGPYKGAPLSLVVVTPAVAGPFDLGDVVVRAGLYVNPETAQITTKTDPIPQILEGVPLQIRSIVVKVDRPNFALNPTSCEKFSVAATVDGSSGAVASPSNPFQVGGCGNLAFGPKLQLSLKGGTHRAGHPALTATLTQPEGQANIGYVQVALPHSEFLAQEHIRTVCTRVQFAAHECPQGSIYGHAEATTPLLEAPLSGPVYLRSSSNKLPDLVAVLRGPESQPIEVALDGRVDSIHGGIRNTFEVIPDAPVSKFVLSMQGGKKGLLVNSTDICEGTHRATVRMVGQNGKRSDSSPAVKAQCGKKHKKAKRHHARSHRRHQLSKLIATW